MVPMEISQVIIHVTKHFQKLNLVIFFKRGNKDSITPLSHFLSDVPPPFSGPYQLRKFFFTTHLSVKS